MRPTNTTRTARSLPVDIQPDTGCLISPRCTTCPITVGCIEEVPPATAAQAAAGLRLVQLQQRYGIATDQAAAHIGMDHTAARDALAAAVRLFAA